MHRGPEVPADSGSGAGELTYRAGDPQQKQDPGAFVERQRDRGGGRAAVQSYLLVFDSNNQLFLLNQH